MRFIPLSQTVTTVTVADLGIMDVPLSVSMVSDVRLDLKAVDLRMEDVRKNGVVVYPIVRADQSGVPREVIGGHLTIAACIQLGRLSVRCQVVKCTKAEAESMRVSLLTEGSVDRDEAFLRALAAYRDEWCKSTGKYRGSSAAAIKRYAAERELSEEAVKKRYQRAKRRLRHKQYMKEDRYEKCPVEDWGVETDRDFREGLYVALDKMAYIKTCLTNASRCWDALRMEADFVLPDSRYESLSSAIAKAQRKLFDFVPAAVCPACKGKDADGRHRCLECLGSGYATNGTIESYGGNQ